MLNQPSRNRRNRQKSDTRSWEETDPPLRTRCERDAAVVIVHTRSLKGRALACFYLPLNVWEKVCWQHMLTHGLVQSRTEAQKVSDVGESPVAHCGIHVLLSSAKRERGRYKKERRGVRKWDGERVCEKILVWERERDERRERDRERRGRGEKGRDTERGATTFLQRTITCSGCERKETKPENELWDLDRDCGPALKQDTSPCLLATDPAGTHPFRVRVGCLTHLAEHTSRHKTFSVQPDAFLIVVFNMNGESCPRLVTVTTKPLRLNFFKKTTTTNKLLLVSLLDC